MITITQNKVAGFEPRWAPFAGFSLLFDNPGDSFTADRYLSKIACVPAPGGPLDLYHRLEKTLNELGRDMLIRTYLFCPLPPASYHMTIWDGINFDNIQSVKPAVYSDWSMFLDRLPVSMSVPPASMDVVARSALTTWSGGVSFQFEKLMLWGDQVLVARLVPAEAVSQETLADLSAHRTKLSEAAEEEFGLSFSQSYSPHISLGYFANQEHGQLAHVQVEHWTEKFRAALKGSIITYSTVDIYGFTDMGSFFKARN